MKSKYRRPTFWLPLLLSAIPVLVFGFFLILLFITIFQLTAQSRMPGFGQGIGFLLFFAAIPAVPLGLFLFIPALTLSVIHRVRFQDEAKGYRRLPLKVTLLVWLPTLYILLRHGFYVFLNFFFGLLQG